MDFQSCLEKQESLKALFSGCATPEERYEKLIELGRSLPPYPKESMTPSHLVKGCQSRLYLHCFLNQEGKMEFLASSDALISAGLAALLLAIYDKESPETILKCPPSVLTELKIMNSLSPSRANGLRNLYLRMQQESIRIIKDKHLAEEQSPRSSHPHA